MLRNEFLQSAESRLAPSFTRDEKSTVAAYLCSGAARVPIPGDAVHFASFAFGESPHSTVPFGSGEAICNDTSGIETMERERKPPRSLPLKKAQKSDLSGSDAAGIHRLPFT